jgi:hypothetical protein
MHLAIKSQISSKYLAIHDRQIVMRYNQIILVLNNLIGKTYRVAVPFRTAPLPLHLLGNAGCASFHINRGGNV